MADLLLRDTDADALAAMIAAAVADAVRPLLAESAEPRLVDRERMAALLSISVPKLDTMTAAGTIPSVSVGRRRLYQPAAVIDALSRD
ncbi:DNA-binding protein [Roseimaritima sediminicola]|uniref:DNA-binding protein n=1 Tax=Roseimaritima sediminicola TaxID=2662066 RepID=UPI001F367CD3|nr:DNA-binding protein [Roseimaritima sediminicola]